MSRLFALQRNISFDNGLSITEERAAPSRGVGALYVSGAEVDARAAAFDSSLRSVMTEIDANPMFGKMEYLTKVKDPAKRAAHEAVGLALGNLSIDWNGNEDEAKDSSGTIKPIPGYYKVLKDMYFKGEAEMVVIQHFESRLKAIVEAYKALGYSLALKNVDPPSDTDRMGRYLKIAGVAIAVGAIGYALVMTQPLWMPAMAGAFAKK